MRILGISAFYHDSAACLLRDGEIVAAAQEERFTRKKHDAGYPENAVAYCLEEGGIRASDLDMVGFYDKPLLTFERLLSTYMAFAPKGFASFRTAMPVWLKEKLWIKERLRERLTGYPGKIYFTEHHESHAASAFFPSPFSQAAVLTMDGVGEWATSSIARGEDGRIAILKEQRFPHSLGMLYSAFTYYLGFKVNSGEYKVMGLAPYGEPKFAGLIRDKLMDLKEDGSFRLDTDYFNYCTGLTMTDARFDALFGGPPRKPESRLTRRDMDLARSIQDVCEEVMLLAAREAGKTAGSKNLCLAGGVALNCVGNGRILREAGFDSVWVQPAAGDAGGALGAAMLLHHQVAGRKRAPDAKDRQRASLLGPAYSDEDIAAFLASRKIPHQRLCGDALYARVAELLSEGAVVGWFQGRMEYGPRALGARSILGDPRDAGMRSRMNLKIKFRESFRPFAPVVLAEDAEEIFEHSGESPYMMFTARVREGKRDIPAVTHVDHSARLQTADRDRHPALHALLTAFKARTGCPVLINTSFNVRGEPIVRSPEEACLCFMKTGMDYLVLGSYLLAKGEQPEAGPGAARGEDFPLD